MDSLKKKARSHIEYQKAQIIAKRRQCQECGEKFPNESLKRNHIISVHQERRSSYPRAKKIVKKPSTPKKSPKPPRSPITAFSQEYWREFPFISKCSDYFPTYKKYNVAIYKKKQAYCNICHIKLNHQAAVVRMHMNSKEHQRSAYAQQKIMTDEPLAVNENFNNESVMDRNCGICKMAYEDGTAAHLMTHMKPCSVLMFKTE